MVYFRFLASYKDAQTIFFSPRRGREVPPDEAEKVCPPQGRKETANFTLMARP